jgi:hypothetical protein
VPAVRRPGRSSPSTAAAITADTCSAAALHRIGGEMGIARRRLHLGVPEQLADHRQALAGADGGRGEGVAQVVDAAVLETGAGALPELLQIDEPAAELGAED